METFRLLALTIVIVISFGCSSREQVRQPDSNTVVVSSTGAININTANKDELRRIPHIGESLAGKIIEHREKHGPFRRPEHLMLLNGISDGRFREIRHLVRAE